MGVIEIVWIALGGTTAVLLALGFLTRSIILHFLSKDIEQYKLKLTAEKDAEIQRLTHQLQLLAQDRHIRFERLHHRRDQVIETLYRKIVEFHRALSAYLDFTALFGKDLTQTKKEDLWGAVDNLRSYVELNRIYFDEPLSELVDKLIATADKPTSMLMIAIEMSEKGEDGPDIMAAWEAARDSLNRDSQAVRYEIEDQFRELLGVSVTH